MYFSGIYQGVNYVTSYPKHLAGGYQQFLVKPMKTFANCFRASYLQDLIVRHTTALKSQFNRDKVYLGSFLGDRLAIVPLNEFD